MDQKEINKILIENKKMIELIAHNSYYEKFKGYIDKEDCIQEAYLLAANFLKKYNSKKGSLSTFLYANLSKALMRYEHENYSLVRLPSHIFDKVRLVKKYCREKNIDTNKITNDFIYECLGEKNRSIDIVKRIIIDGSVCKYMDFDTKIDDKVNYEYYNEIDRDLDLKLLNQKLSIALSFESKSNIELFNDYYIDEYKLHEIAERNGVSTSAIGARIDRLRDRIKKRITTKRRIKND